MKKILLISIIILSLSSCATIYGVKDNQEYVLMQELDLTAKQRFILHWSTYSDSDFAVFDSRSGKYLYKKNYDYSFLKK